MNMVGKVKVTEAWIKVLYAEIVQQASEALHSDEGAEDFEKRLKLMLQPLTCGPDSIMP